MASVLTHSFLCLLLIAGYTVSKVIKVSTSDQLASALLQVTPGDNISLSGNTTFSGTFVAARNGSYLLPITILTEDFDKTYYAILDGQGAKNASTLKHVPALHIVGNYYNLENIKILNNNSLGILIEGNEISLDGVLVQGTKKGIWIKGEQSYIKDSAVSDTLQGIQVDGDFAIVRDSFVTGNDIVSISSSKESCCGTLMGNVLDGTMDIRGTDFNIFDNVIAGSSQ